MNRFLFLLYLSVMLIITFLQQEFVLLPEIQSLDIIGDDSREIMIGKFQKSRFISFIIPPAILALRLSLVSLCLFLGSFFYVQMQGKSYKEWWNVALKSQFVLLLYSVILCIVNISFGENKAMDVNKYSSLLFLAPDTVNLWIKLPLSVINIFEVVYWCVMSLFVCNTSGTNFRISFRFVLSSYGVGYLFYISLLMFLMLYLA